MATTNLFLAKTAVVMKLSKVGVNAAICHKCGRIFVKAKGKTLCKDCQQ